MGVCVCVRTCVFVFFYYVTNVDFLNLISENQREGKMTYKREIGMRQQPWRERKMYKRDAKNQDETIITTPFKQTFNVFYVFFLWGGETEEQEEEEMVLCKHLAETLRDRTGAIYG